MIHPRNWLKIDDRLYGELILVEKIKTLLIFISKILAFIVVVTEIFALNIGLIVYDVVRLITYSFFVVTQVLKFLVMTLLNAFEYMTRVTSTTKLFFPFILSVATITHMVADFFLQFVLPSSKSFKEALSLVLGDLKFLIVNQNLVDKVIRFEYSKYYDIRLKTISILIKDLNSKSPDVNNQISYIYCQNSNMTTNSIVRFINNGFEKLSLLNAQWYEDLKQSQSEKYFWLTLLSISVTLFGIKADNISPVFATGLVRGCFLVVVNVIANFATLIGQAVKHCSLIMRATDTLYFPSTAKYRHTACSKEIKKHSRLMNVQSKKLNSLGMSLFSKYDKAILVKGLLFHFDKKN
ncbi:MAG: hypothetical protein P8L77_03680 [Gammaproteobacteria bacterium]|nr:hypothetical protein [Gammaproteobacteria bacterium]